MGRAQDHLIRPTPVKINLRAQICPVQNARMAAHGLAGSLKFTPKGDVWVAKLAWMLNIQRSVLSQQRATLWGPARGAPQEVLAGPVLGRRAQNCAPNGGFKQNHPKVIVRATKPSLLGSTSATNAPCRRGRQCQQAAVQQFFLLRWLPCLERLAAVEGSRAWTGRHNHNKPPNKPKGGNYHGKPGGPKYAKNAAETGGNLNMLTRLLSCWYPFKPS